MLSGAARWLKTIYPNCTVDLLIPAWVSSAVGAAEGFDRVLIWDYSWSWFKRLKVIIRLRSYRYTGVYIFEQANRKTKTGFFFGGKYLFSFKNKYHILCTKTYAYDNQIHETQNFAHLLRLSADHLKSKKVSGLYESPKMINQNLPPVLAASKEEKDFAREYLQRLGIEPRTRFVVLHPFGSPDTLLRFWPLAHYGKLARLLIREGIVVLFSGHGKEIEQIQVEVEKIESEATLKPHQLVLTTAPLSQRQLGAVLELSLALVVHNTGPMHLATAVGTPVVALFGSTDPLKTGPAPGDSPRKIIRVDFQCSPCDYSESDAKKKCWDQQFADCMPQITPERVMEALGQYIETK